MISVTDLAMHYGGQTLFEDVNLRFDPGKRYGIVGANGSGKSTLLRILAEQEQMSAGDVSRPKKMRLGVLEQDHFQYEDVRILDLAMMGNEELWNAMVEKEAVLANPEFDDERYGELEDVVLRYNGYELESRAGRILEGLGIPTAVHHEPLSVLSGGFKLRALLAKTLASEPDLLFLDEPTNHLDILAIKWLEDFLVSFPGITVVVSHDLAFLDNFATHILDVDYQRVTLYRGNYTAFTRLKVEERDRQEAEIAKREKEMADHKAFIARFKAKATKARQANSRQKRLEKIEITSLPTSSRRYPRFSFQAARPSGREVLKVENLSKAYDDKVVLEDVSFTVMRGDRIAIIGPNGIGKSTLLTIAMGLKEPDEGHATWGYEATPGYFPQNHDEALGDPSQSVASYLWTHVPDEGLGNVLARLAAVLFSKDDTEKAVGNLSGGEASRLLFAKIASEQPTVLVLDEPTNHLDLEGIEALADALKAYDGTLIFVSHDRWFVNALATRVIEITPDGVEDFHGTYAEFLRHNATDHLDAEKVVEAARREKREQKKKAKKKR
jgi:ATPase subunit of ABC transporter with duplicated ATPase domains